MFPIRIKACSESDLRMLGNLARNIQRVLPVTQADIDAAAALGKGWVVWKVVEVNDPIDNLRGGTQLVIKQNSITPGQNVRRVLIVSGPGGETVVIGPGPSPLLLPDAVANSLQYVKAFGGTKQGLPDGYTQLEYIVFDSTQVIDTGFTPDNNSRIESKCYRTGADCWFYGASPSNPRVTLYHSNTGTCRWGNQSRSNVGFVADTEYTIIQDKNGLNINGVDNPWASGTADYFTCDRTLTIGNCNGGTGTRYFAGNLYYMKIYNNDVLARDFVPCKNASNVVGLYDKVNGVFYTDTGLVAGPEATPTPDTPINIVSNNGVLKARHQSGLPLGYTLLEYIESTGTQYIDTGYFFTDVATETVTTDFMRTSASSTGSLIYGFRDSYKVNGYGIQVSNNGSTYMQYGTIDSGLGSTPTASMNTRYTITQTGPKYVFLGASYTSTGETPTQNYPLTVFAINNGGAPTASNMTMMRLYGMTIKDANNVVKMNLVPVKRSDNVLGVFDTVSGQFFTNAGTGDFTAGSAVSDPVEIYTDGTVETIKDSLNNTATTEMLLKVGDYQDVQSIIDGVVTRNVGIKVLDGTENWSVNSTSNAPFRITISDMEYSKTIGLDNIFGICSHFQAVANTASWVNYNNMVSVIENSRNVCFRYLSGISNVNTFKQFLADQYAAGTPVIVIYPLATPTTESVTGQTLQVTDGDNVLEITQASLTGLELEAEYTKAE